MNVVNHFRLLVYEICDIAYYLLLKMIKVTFILAVQLIEILEIVFCGEALVRTVLV